MSKGNPVNSLQFRTFYEGSEEDKKAVKHVFKKIEKYFPNKIKI